MIAKALAVALALLRLARIEYLRLINSASSLAWHSLAAKFLFPVVVLSSEAVPEVVRKDSAVAVAIAAKALLKVLLTIKPANELWSFQRLS